MLIIYADGEKDIEPLIGYIRGIIDESCEKEEKPYKLSVSAGFDELLRGEDPEPVGRDPGSGLQPAGLPVADILQRYCISAVRGWRITNMR